MGLSDVLRDVEAAGLSGAERKFLRRRAVEVAAVAGAASPPCRADSSVLVCFEELMASVAESSGQAVGLGR